MKTLSRMSLTVSLCIIAAYTAYSCSCADPSLRQRFRNADSVFLGEVVRVNDRVFDKNDKFNLFFYEVTIHVEKQWKGKREHEILTWADYDAPGMCNDLDVSVGKKLLVFAPRKEGHLLIERECGPNRPADYAKNEIKKLNDFFFRVYAFLYPFPKL